ncbi:hypothetical protein H2203_007913 [Taxawa tesnikishii (nom. ined.)]|nr:hypothetical protein H2203_007913 [Dothideales sp. JES 119]
MRSNDLDNGLVQQGATSDQFNDFVRSFDRRLEDMRAQQDRERMELRDLLATFAGQSTGEQCQSRITKQQHPGLEEQRPIEPQILQLKLPDIPNNAGSHENKPEQQLVGLFSSVGLNSGQGLSEQGMSLMGASHTADVGNSRFGNAPVRYSTTTASLAGRPFKHVATTSNLNCETELQLMRSLETDLSRRSEISREIFRPGNVITDWIRDCVHSHGRRASCCAAAKGRSGKPLRLIRIGGDGESICVLIETDINDVPDYVALSHCWGREGMPLLTTKMNIELLKQGIHWQSLPRTFQEAIMVTLALGYHYLWIDALCIVQDDIEDWSLEASRMHHIFGNVLITLAAASGSSDSAGLLPSLLRPIKIATDMQHDLQSCTLNELPQLPLLSGSRDITNSSRSTPWYRSGWTLCDRAYSARILHCTDNDLFFECPTGIRSLSRQIAHREPHLIRDPHNLKTMYAAAVESDKEKEAADFWWKMVVEYSAKTMVNETDWLVALSGLAQTLAPKMGQYCAGMWAMDLPNSLLWQRKSTGDRPAYYIAPTWSWPSVIGPGVMDERLTIPPEKRTFTITQCETIPATADNYGPLSGGHLVLEAPIVTASVVSCETEEGKCYLTLLRDGRQITTEETDVDPGLAPDSTVRCLQLGEDESGNTIAMILTPSRRHEEDGEMNERVDLMTCYRRRGENRWFNGAHREQVWIC